jgi:dTDP-4-amino-4,6-dideoxygalactose transaminase
MQEASRSEKFVPFHRPSIGTEEIDEVVETLRSGWLTTGPRTARFERDFREYVGADNALAVSSATAALHLALAAAKIGPGDEVITTPMTFCATVQAILHAGAEPVLADIGPDGNIDPNEIEKRMTHRTRAIIPVHMAGLPCEMGAIWDLAERRDLRVIEDAAHAVGARYDGRPIGSTPNSGNSSSDAVAFSFYATKNLTTGEGGMLTTRCPEIAESARMLSLHGTSRNAWDRYTEHGDWHYDVLAHGFKYNLSDIQSAIGIHQLRKLERFIERRTALAEIYERAFAGWDEIELPPNKKHCRHAWHLYVIRLNLEHLKIDRSGFVRELKNRGIGASVHFIPIQLHHYFRGLGLAKYACPRALALYPRIVSLPLYPGLTDEEALYVANSVTEILKHARQTKFVAPNASVIGTRPAA